MTDASPSPVPSRPRWGIRPADLPLVYLAATAFSIALYALLPSLGDAAVGMAVFAVLLCGLPMVLLVRFARHGGRAFAAGTSAPEAVPMADSRPARRSYRRFGGPLMLAAGLGLVYALAHTSAGPSNRGAAWAAVALMLVTPLGFVGWLGDRHR